MKDKNMTNPLLTALNLQTKLTEIQTLLTGVEDQKSEVIFHVKTCQEMLNQLREQMNERERKKQHEQLMFCDKLAFEFSVNADFSESYSRNYEDMLIDGETIKNIISNERQLQNMNDEYLFARVTITDTDPET
jgi:glucan-binding YG repeat protein